MDGKEIKLSLKGLSKSFEAADGSKFEAVRAVDIDVYDKEFLVLLGPGHCGKSVIMNMIQGLLEPTEGAIELDGQPLSGGDPRVGMVFQTTALMPWFTVMENAELGLKFAGVPKKERRRIAQQNIDLVGLHGFESAYPRQLSGGMKQRVGIARAYTYNPEVLLMDEPFGALDAQTRYAMEGELIRIWEQEKRTIIFVTNNIEEALYLSDRIILFSKCPASVKGVYINDLPRPRDQMSPEFLALRQKISDNTDLLL